MIRLISLISLTAIFLSSCESSVPKLDLIKYKVTVDVKWSEDTHPTEFPRNGAYIGRITGMIHSKDLTLFSTKKPASEGLKKLAIDGDPILLNQELEDRMAQNLVNSIVYNETNAVAPSKKVFEIEIPNDKTFPLISLACKIGPSPDWFLANLNTSLYYSKKWVSKISLTMYPYDAGVDKGTTFLSEQASQPNPSSVSVLREGPLVADGLYDPLKPKEIENPLATITLERIN